MVHESTQKTRLYIGMIYLQPSQGQTLRDAVGVFAQPFLERPSSYPDILLLDPTEHYQSVTGIFKVRGAPADYLEAFYTNGRTHAPDEVTRVLVSRGFKKNDDAPLSREEINRLLHRWFFGTVFNQRTSPEYLRQALQEEETVNYAFHLKNEIRIRSSGNEEAMRALPDRLVQKGITGHFIDYMPPILYRDIDGELETTD